MNLDLRLYQEMEKDISLQLEQLAAEILAGKVADFADYRHRIGRIKGLQDALVTLQDAQKRVLGVER